MIFYHLLWMQKCRYSGVSAAGYIPGQSILLARGFHLSMKWCAPVAACLLHVLASLALRDHTN